MESEEGSSFFSIEENRQESIWIGRPALFSCTKVILTSSKLKIEKSGGSEEFSLRDIGKIQVRHSFVDRILRTGNLLIEIHGKKNPLLLRGLLNPYEGWKQIKIAKFSLQKRDPLRGTEGVDK